MGIPWEAIRAAVEAKRKAKLLVDVDTTVFVSRCRCKLFDDDFRLLDVNVVVVA